MPTQIFFNQITVIQSLNTNEPQTGLELCRDIIERKIEQLKIKNIKAKLITVTSKSELLNVLKNLKFKLGGKSIIPYIHFEMHGREEGLVLRTGELINWKELQPLLIGINGSVKNNLFVSLASCFGGNIINSIDLLKRSPLYGFIGSWNKIHIGDIREDWEAYFTTLLENRDFNLAVDELNKSKEKDGNGPEYKPRYAFYLAEMVFDITSQKWQESFQDEASKVPELRKTISEQAIKMKMPRDLTDEEVYRSWQYSFVRLPSLIGEIKDHFLFKRAALPNL